MNLLRWLSIGKKPQPSKPVCIVTNADGLRISGGAEDEAETTRALRWEDVILVGAYRKDCYGFDLCCVELLSKSGGSILIHEQEEGFVDACFAITQNLAVRDPDWFLTLQTRQAFDTSIDFVYKRPDSEETASTLASS